MKICKVIDYTWYLERNEYRQGKLRLYSHLMERPYFEQYLNLSNPKLRQVMTKIRIIAQRLPIETRRFENKPSAKRICSLDCDDIGDDVHFLIECKDIEINTIRSNL